MRRRRLCIVLTGIVLVLAGLCLVLRLYMGRAAEDTLQPGERVVIEELRDPIPGNAFLACPTGFCAATAAPAPEFAISRERLEAAFNDMMAGETNVVAVEDEPERHRRVVIQHTPLLRFPDIVAVEFIAIGADRSTLAIYSRARYGKGDFGTNRRRVLRRLDRLKQIAG